ncbi:hypothetical protein ABD05_12405 [Burkholderia pyrrocinia]|nr:hypothetical protein ABD05_12405 [Burkholderia pyrrocinia]
MQVIQSRQIAMLGDHGQLLVMYAQHALDVSQLVLDKRPSLTAFGSRDTSIQYCFRPSIQVKIRTGSRLASHEKR